MVQVSGPALKATPQRLSPPSFQSPKQTLSPSKVEKQRAEAQPDLPRGPILLSSSVIGDVPLGYPPLVASISLVTVNKF
ncbi:hypothetical protein Fmac_001546 [Flemingia macrophylla]|uniref:Uncharacterized protein n=1 Tax=Flemingia macrophylla TaxID=520843 RepID=A0ABD1NHE4_9FABA